MSREMRWEIICTGDCPIFGASVMRLDSEKSKHCGGIWCVMVLSKSFFGCGQHSQLRDRGSRIGEFHSSISSHGSSYSLSAASGMMTLGEIVATDSVIVANVHTADGGCLSTISSPPGDVEFIVLAVVWIIRPCIAINFVVVVAALCVFLLFSAHKSCHILCVLSAHTHQLCIPHADSQLIFCWCPQDLARCALFWHSLTDLWSHKRVKTMQALFRVT